MLENNRKSPLANSLWRVYDKDIEIILNLRYYNLKCFTKLSSSDIDWKCINQNSIMEWRKLTCYKPQEFTILPLL